MVIFLCSITILSCASHRWTSVDEGINIEQLIQEKFPELYARHQSQEIVIDKVQQCTENGETRYRITYSERTDDSDELLWQTVYMPLLNQ